MKELSSKDVEDMLRYLKHKHYRMTVTVSYEFGEDPFIVKFSYGGKEVKFASKNLEGSLRQAYPFTIDNPFAKVLG